MMKSTILSNLNFSLLWDKVTEFAKKAGKASVRPVLLLYLVLKNPATPKSDKLLIISALSYLILPIDLISAKRLPVIGWVDEIAAITVAYKKVSRHITPEMKTEAESLLEKWFPEVEYATVID